MSIECTSSIESIVELPSARDSVAEANHRIANNLMLVASLLRTHARSVSSQPHTFTGEEVRLLLEEVGGRIESIGRLHGLLAHGDGNAAIDVATYVRDISEATVSSIASSRAAYLSHTSTQACFLLPKQALQLGLIVGELVTNAVKYAHPTGVTGRIAVGCRRAKGAIVVEVADDGVGLPEGFDPATSGGLGFRLVRSLVEQLGAKLVYESTGTGLSVRLYVPA